jgi:hypothetical protein
MIATVGAGRELANRAGFFIRDDDRGARQDRALLVGHLAAYV